MNPGAELARSLRGWGLILAGQDGTAHFRLDAAGVAVAVLWLVVGILLSVAVQSAAIGMPSLPAVALGLLTQALTVGALALAIVQTLRFLRLAVAPAALLVPTLYALGYVFVLAVPLALVGPNAALLAMLGLAVMEQRAARVVAGMATSTSIAFAVLCVIVLVVVPNALYIVFSQFTSPA